MTAKRLTALLLGVMPVLPGTMPMLLGVAPVLPEVVAVSGSMPAGMPVSLAFS